MKGNLDLHVHTSVSDGRYRPSTVVRMAAEAGLSAIAITDHDSVAGIKSALKSGREAGLDVIPGVEISTLIDGSECHILGYFIDRKSPRLLRTFGVLKESRADRAGKMVEALSRFGLSISLDQVSEQSEGDVIGRPHIAQVLVNQGHADSIEDAFNRYLVRGSPGYVERYKIPPSEAIEVIREAGGVPVVAHPLNNTALVPALAAQGLMGLEVFYRGYSAGEISELISLARRYDLVTTGGTDFHGRPEPEGTPLGSVYVPPDTLDKLRACLPTALKQTQSSSAVDEA